MSATHSISLHVQVDNPEHLKELRSRFCLQLKALPDDVPYSNLTVFRLDGVEEDNDGGEFYDDNTLTKVYEAVIKKLQDQPSLLLSDDDLVQFARDIVNQMQNAGILFRERRPHGGD